MAGTARAWGETVEQAYLREMRVADLDQVLAIERLSFLTPWSPNAFLTELTENAYADYVVAVVPQSGAGGSASRPVDHPTGEQVVGYGGMWIVLDESHVTNIAVHPDFRGKKIGELILGGMMTRAVWRGARRMTLEVRKSNLVAQKLYVKLGFEPKGIRKDYYTDTKEDAIIMWKDRLF